MPKVELFANNLRRPTHMEWTKDGRLLVSEHTAGIVKDITDGGDASKIDAFASDLRGPASILPTTDGRILVSETWGGRVTDIARGGDKSLHSPFRQELSMPYSLVERDGRIFVSESFNGRDSWLSDITEEHSIRYVDGIPTRPGSPSATPVDEWANGWQHFAAANCTINWGGSGRLGHFIAIGALGQILDITAGGGNYIDLLRQNRVIAWDLGRLGAIKEHPVRDLIYAVEPELGDVVAVDPKNPENQRFSPPVVRGFISPSCLRFNTDGTVMYVCSSGEGAVWKVTNF